MMMFMNKSVDRLMMQKSMEPIIKEIIDNKISKEKMTYTPSNIKAIYDELLKLFNPSN